MAEYTLIPKASLKQVLAFNEVCKTYQRELATASAEGDDMVKAIIAGAAMNQLRTLLTDQVMADVMQLVGTPLGISVETGKKWPVEVVRDVVLAGLLNGARIVGGEMHIASGKLYLTKVYWERRFKEFPGVSDVKPPDLGLPRPQKLGEKEYATVQAKLEYRLNGKLQRLDRTGDSAITVVWNSGMGLDAIHGKVKKRLYQIAYGVVSGMQVDEDPEDIVTVESPAGFHDPLHTEEAAPYSVAGGHAAEAATDVDQTPDEFSPEAEFTQAIRDAKNEAAAKAAAQAADEAGFPMPQLLADKLEAMRVNKAGRPKQKELA